ncbi:MAG: hypoxanthine phosphoribosyltransferase, partial [Clostridia bacterium]|nr:hypoxanthine phosphoribosyltransferase [Clostridia bacterium]
MNNDIKSVLVSEKELDEIVTGIANKVSEDYRGRRLLLVCILKGAVVFMGDLMKKISIPVEIDFMKVSSYGNSTKTSGAVNILLDLHRKDLADTDILIVEDIIDSGKTLSYLVEYLLLKGARSVKTATMIDKPS